MFVLHTAPEQIRNMKNMIRVDDTQAMTMCQTILDDVYEFKQHIDRIISIEQIRDKMETIKSLIGTQNDQAIGDCDDLVAKIEDSLLYIESTMSSDLSSIECPNCPTPT
jgi:hypothetical protein